MHRSTTLMFPGADIGGGVLCSEPAGDSWLSRGLCNKHREPTYSAVRNVRAMVGTPAQRAAQILKEEEEEKHAAGKCHQMCQHNGVKLN